MNACPSLGQEVSLLVGCLENPHRSENRCWSGSSIVPQVTCKQLEQAQTLTCHLSTVPETWHLPSSLTHGVK